MYEGSNCRASVKKKKEEYALESFGKIFINYYCLFYINQQYYFWYNHTILYIRVHYSLLALPDTA